MTPDKELQYQARIGELREALAFYANGDHWEWNDRQMEARVLLDVGTKAANALSRPDDLSALNDYVLEEKRKVLEEAVNGLHEAGILTPPASALIREMIWKLK